MVPLAEKLVAAFTKENRSVMAVCEGGGSTAGIVALRRGVIDVAIMSRDVRGSEDAPGIISYPYARNAVAIVVHPSNPLEDLSMETIRSVLVGDVADWARLHGAAGAIRVVSRQEGSTTLQSVNDLVLFGEDMTPDAQPEPTSVELMKKVAAEPNALGFVSYADLEHSPANERPTIKVLIVNKVPMQRETILSGRYPLTRVMHFVVQEKQTPTTHGFVAFIRSAEGRRITTEHGLIPVW